jgi:hypothetical protein
VTSNFLKIANPSVAALYEDALVYETGSAITATGALSAYSGAKTGRSPSDKRIVKEEGSENDIWWGPVNKPMSTDVSRLYTTKCFIWFGMICMSGYTTRVPRGLVLCVLALAHHPYPNLELTMILITDRSGK